MLHSPNKQTHNFSISHTVSVLKLCWYNLNITTIITKLSTSLKAVIVMRFTIIINKHLDVHDVFMN